MATDFFLAPLAALKEGSPLEVKESDKHEAESDVNGNDHGPVSLVFFRSLDCHQLILYLEVGAGRGWNAFVASCHNVNLVGAAEVMGFALLHDSEVLYLFLIHPEAWVEGTPELHFTTFRKFGHSYSYLVRKHSRPDVWLIFFLPGFVLQDEKAGTIDFAKRLFALFFLDVLS